MFHIAQGIRQKRICKALVMIKAKIFLILMTEYVYRVAFISVKI